MNNDKLWSQDLGNGIYRNPILFADYSDPDVIRVGDTYYMTASSFNYTPGLPILESGDLVNWKLINYAVENIDYPDYVKPQHSKGIWAPAIRYHDGWFYIFYGMPDEGIFMVRTKDPHDTWETPVLVLEGKGLIDSCPFWDEDGKAYVVHAYAKSRIGFKSFLGLFEMTPDGTKAVSEDHLIFDGTKTQMTIEGPKMLKRNTYYYIFAPAGGVTKGWQTVLRSRDIAGPYEEKIVMRQGDSPVNGPHQGGLVDTPEGEEWFIHFQDMGAYGRVVHLQPVCFRDGWPIIGIPKAGEDWGEPCLFHKKPALPAQESCTLQASDDFSGEKLDLKWQWLGNHRDDFYSLTACPGYLRLYSLNPSKGDPVVLWNCANVLTQKIICPNSIMTAHMCFQNLKENEQAGVIVIGGNYGWLGVRNTKGSRELIFSESFTKEGTVEEKVLKHIPLQKGIREINLRIQIQRGRNVDAIFSYSLDGENYKKIDSKITLAPHTWVGAKTGLFSVACDKDDHDGSVEFSKVHYDNPDNEPDPVFQIAEDADFDTIKYMVEFSKSSMNIKDERNRTPLHYAAKHQSREVLEYFVNRVGLSPLEGDCDLITPYEVACQNKNQEALTFFEKVCGASLSDMYKNPIRTGMYPDPSMVRVGDDYYMVNSSFVYFPCIPISHSRDLIHWEIIGHGITDSNWAALGHLEGGRGYWAPDISYTNGRYYITATYRMNDDGVVIRKQMIVSSDRPEGPYSEPIFIDEDGIDPSLFHDDDGRHYMLLNRGARIVELNQDMTKQISEASLLYYGDMKRAPEGPHLLKKDDYYYLFLAEGGTGMGHRITVARSKSLKEPFVPCPYNPIMRQTDPNALIQRCGHGKPVSTPDGRWFIAYLCGRMPDQKHTLLGRETALDEIVWTADGWPLINNGDGPSVMAKKPYPALQDCGSDGWTYDICKGEVSKEWMSPRGIREKDIERTSEGIFMKGDPSDLDSLDARDVLLRRQTSFDYDVKSKLTIRKLEEYGETGLVCYYDERTWLKFGVFNQKGDLYAFVEENRGNKKTRKELGKLENSKKLSLSCEVRGLTRSFLLESENGETIDIKLDQVDYLCDEGHNYGKRFTGPTIGIFCLGCESEILISDFASRQAS